MTPFQYADLMYQFHSIEIILICVIIILLAIYFKR